MAATLDGYIADVDGGIDWLDPFSKVDYGYDAFIAEIETVVIGRRTYDQVQDLIGWPYGERKAIVVSHRPAYDLPRGAEVWQGTSPISSPGFARPPEMMSG